MISRQSKIVGILLVGFALVAYLILPLINRRSFDRLPNINAVIVTSTRHSDGNYSIIAYNCRNASLWRKKTKLEELRGLYRRCYQPHASENLSGIFKSKMIRGTLNKQITYGITCFRDEIFILTEDSRGVVLNCYNTKAQLEKQTRFIFPFELDTGGQWPAVEINERRIAIATEGKNVGVYLSDRNGKIIRFIEHAYNPYFSSDGLRMIYITKQSKASHKSRIVFYDLKSNKIIRSLSVGFQIMQNQMAPDENSMIAMHTTIRYSPSHETYAIDLRKSHFQVYKLPIEVEPSHWTVIDSVPKSFKRINKD